MKTGKRPEPPVKNHKNDRIATMLSFFRQNNQSPSPSNSNQIAIRFPQGTLQQLARIRVRVRARARPIPSSPLPELPPQLLPAIRPEMPLFPFLHVDHNRAHFRSLNPNFTYVARLGRNRRPHFVRATPGRTTSYIPPPWRVPDEDCHPVCPICESGCRGCGYSDDGCSDCLTDHFCSCPSDYEPRSYIACPTHIPPSSDTWHGQRGRSSRGSGNAGFSIADLASGRGSSRRHVGGHSPGRNVHWPDGHSDGSLSPCPSLVSSSSTISSNSSSPSRYGVRPGGGMYPRTPVSSPERSPRVLYRSPERGGCDGVCANSGRSRRHRGHGRARPMTGGSRWRDIPCFDEDYGPGVVREPRF